MSKLKTQNFYTRSVLFSILSIAAAAINYALYPVLARIVNISEFGDFAVVIAISTQVTGILMAFNVISIYLVKTNSEHEALEKAQLIQKVLVWVFVLATFAVLLCAPFLTSILQIGHSASFIILALILLFSIPASVWTGYLQGHKELVRIGLYILSSAIFRLLSVTILAFLFGAVAGLLGFAIGMVLGLIVLRLLPGVRTPQVSSIFKKITAKEKSVFKALGPYIAQSIFVVGSFGLLQNFDITLSKMLFGPDSAGAYSGISMLSNALYYVLFLLVWIILPEISVKDQSINRRVLSTSFKIISLTAIGALVVILLFNNHIINLLLGDGFMDQGNTLVFATLYKTTLVAITLYAFYLLICRKKSSMWLTASVLVSCLIFPAVFAQTALQMIVILWLSLLLGATIGWIISKLIFSEAVSYEKK